jgi:hypothetical protein
VRSRRAHSASGRCGACCGRRDGGRCQALSAAVVGRGDDGDADVGVEQVERKVVDEGDLGHEVGVGAVELHQRPADGRSQQLRLRDFGAIAEALEFAAGLDPGLAEPDAQVGRSRHVGARARA